ncbi:hypothetical protein Q3G72_006066 [Acer saccharum]|nr:hypothetical protein Q3G72_006066 [Acer saccharum]
MSMAAPSTPCMTSSNPSMSPSTTLLGSLVAIASTLISPLVISTVKWFEDELELNALCKPAVVEGVAMRKWCSR